MQFGRGDGDMFSVKSLEFFLKKYMYIYLRTLNNQKVSTYFRILHYYTVSRLSSLNGRIRVGSSGETIVFVSYSEG